MRVRAPWNRPKRKPTIEYVTFRLKHDVIKALEYGVNVDAVVARAKAEYSFVNEPEAE